MANPREKKPRPPTPHIEKENKNLEPTKGGRLPDSQTNKKRKYIEKKRESSTQQEAPTIPAKKLQQLKGKC